MNTFIENKSKKIALAFTMALHGFLFLLFLSVVFVKPSRSIEKETFFSLGTFPDNEKKVSDEHKINTPLAKMKGTAIATNRNRENFTVDPTETTLMGQNGSVEVKNILKKKKSQAEKNNTTSITNLIIGEKDENPELDPKASSVELKGRILIEKPAHIMDSQEEGTVVVEIIVDETGKVIKAAPGQRKSTTTSSWLYELARRAACQAKFNPSPEGIKEQRGSYTFVFTLE